MCGYCRACRDPLSLLLLLLPLLSLSLLPSPAALPSAAPRVKIPAHLPLRFRYVGTSKILQVVCMHFGNVMVTRCRDVPSAETAWCSDLNAPRFFRRMIRAEDPNLVVFTGFGYHGYGRANWPRGRRVVQTKLRRGKNAWLGVESIRAWKRLDHEKLTKFDDRVLWSHDGVRLD